MASGMPIPMGTKMVVLFVCPNCSIERFAHKPEDKFNYVSFPMFLTAGDYGVTEKFGMRDESLTKQLTWKIFEKFLYTVPEKDSKDFVMNLNWGDTGFLPFTFNLYSGQPLKPKPTMFTCYRKDVWDYLCGMQDPECMAEFNKCMQEAVDSNEFADREIPWGEFLHRKLQSLVVRGESSRTGTLRWNQRRMLQRLVTEMRAFVYGLDIIGQPILPAFGLSQQGGWDDYYKLAAGFRQFCADTITKGVNERQREMGY